MSLTTPALPLPADALPGAPRRQGAGRHLRLVDDSVAARQRRARRLLLGGVVLGSLLFFGVVATQVVIVQGQFRLEQVEGRADEAQATYDRLRLEVAELESPARVVAAAQALGMVQPDEVTYLTPEPGAAPPAPGAPPALTGRSQSATADDWAAAGATPVTSWTAVKPHLAGR